MPHKLGSNSHTISSYPLRKLEFKRKSKFLPILDRLRSNTDVSLIIFCYLLNYLLPTAVKWKFKTFNLWRHCLRDIWGMFNYFELGFQRCYSLWCSLWARKPLQFFLFPDFIGDLYVENSFFIANLLVDLSNEAITRVLLMLWSKESLITRRTSKINTNRQIN